MRKNTIFCTILSQSLILLLSFSAISLQGKELKLDSELASGALRKSGLTAPEEGISIPLNSTFAGYTVKVNINEKPVQLILDTGSAATVLSPKTAERLGLVVTEYKGIGFRDISGDELELRQALTKRITLGKAWTQNEPVLIHKMPKGLTADGVLGISTLADWDVRINPIKMTLILFPEGKAKSLAGETKIQLKYQLLNPKASSSNPQGLRRMNLRVPVVIGSHEIMVIPDTGMSGTLLLSSVLLNKCDPIAMKNASASLTSGIAVSGNTIATSTAKLSQFTLGTDTLRELPIEVEPAKPNTVAAQKGVLGRNILRHYIITFRFSKGELCLQPLGTIQEITRSSTAGMALSRDANNRFFILSVIPNGPASRAGLLAKDELLEIEGKAFKTIKPEEFIAFKSLPPGANVKIRYRRGKNKAKEVTITLDKK